MRKYTSVVILYFSLLLSVIGYFFSISEASFAWLFPDEILLSRIFNERGLFGCMYFYYTETTIFRLGNLSSACLLSAGVELFESPYLGWAYMRLIIYFLLAISIACLLRNIISTSKITSLLVSFILSTITLFILSDTNGAPFYMYGLDLTAYGIATITFYLMISIFSKIDDGSKYFFAFSVLLVLNMTALETFLIISGILILIYVTHYYYKMPFIKFALITREYLFNIKSLLYYCYTFFV